MTNSTPTPADALIAALHEPGRENLLDLVRNPLRLTLLCMTWDGSSLPETQAELYDRYLRKIYEWNQNWHELEKYAERCGTNTTKLKQNLNQQLGELAKAALNLPQERFRLSQALVEEYLGEELDKTSLGYLALRLGWLNRVGRDGRGDAIFAFYHATFQEYFAALAVADWDYFLPRGHVDCPVEGKRYRIFEKQWKQVILFWLGREDIGNEEKEAFIRALVEFNDGCGEWNFEKVDRGFYEYQAYFLAAIGISEFKKCTLADEIIKQITKLALGYFDIEKQELITFFDSSKAIKESAREILRIINRPKIIKDLTGISFYEECSIIFSELGLERDLLHTLNSLGDAYSNLAQKGLDSEKNLEKAILNYKKAVSISQKFSSDKDRLLVLYAMAKKYNVLAEQGINSEESSKEAIALHKEACDLCRRLGLEGYLWDNLKGLGNAHFSLAQMGLDSEQNFQKSIFYYEESCGVCKNLGLEKEILNTLDRIGETYLHLAEIGLDINENFKKAIFHYEEACDICRKLNLDEDLFSILIKLAKFYRNSSKLKCDSQHNFTKIIDELIENFEQTRNKLTNYRCGLLETATPSLSVIYESNCWIAADQLAIFAKDAPNVVNTLMNFLQNYNYWTRKQKSLFTIKIQESESSIYELINFFRDIANDIKIFPCKTILRINILSHENIEERINVLIDIITDVFFEDMYNDAIDLLKETITEFPLYAKTTKNKLLSILKSTDNNNIRRSAAYSLGKIAQGNPEAIAALIRLLETTQDEDTRRKAAYSLGKILTTPEQYAEVVSGLKNNLRYEVYQNNFDQFNKLYEVIWNCAENLSYPDFYQAWHNPPTTPHPEVEDNTPVASTPFTQQCNLALLPQILNQANQTRPLNRQIICIDGSRFSDPSNPALQIYTTLKKAGCPPSPDGKPRTIAELQAYCDDDLSDHQIALILYEEPTDPPPQGFDIAVLNQLARFSHPPIAVVVGDRLAECRLPQFLESDPDLMATLLQWLQNLER